MDKNQFFEIISAECSKIELTSQEIDNFLLKAMENKLIDMPTMRWFMEECTSIMRGRAERLLERLQKKLDIQK